MKLVISKIIPLLIGGICGLFALVFLAALILSTKYHGRIYPGISIGGVAVGGLSPAEAQQAIDQQISAYFSSWPTHFLDQLGNQYPLEISSSHLIIGSNTTVQSAFNYGRAISPQSLSHLFSLLYSPPQFNLNASFDSDWLSQSVATIAAEVNIPTVPPQLEIKTLTDGSSVVQVNPGHNGQFINAQLFQQQLNLSLATLTPPSPNLPIEVEINAINSDQIAAAQSVATKLLSSTIELQFSPSDNGPSQKSWQLSSPELIQFIRFEGGFNSQKITEYLEGVAQSINQPPKDAKFQFDETTSKVTEFVPAENGIILDVEKSSQLLTQALTDLASDNPINPITLAYSSVSPDVSLSEVNRLGIKERIGIGTSTYKGSITSRVHNVALAAARLNGTLIKPGEEFSFNQAVGEISAATGYQAAYIIQNGRTELGDGGGVCQDSTTVFRAALDAGLPITSRKGHAYRVGYYEQDAKPGLDATVFSPSTDFRFTNDTPGHILIQTIVDSPNRHLTVIFYGTNDGRQSEIIDHLVWDVTPPPPDVFVDDPTLAPGQVKQIDWRASGAKAKFTYRVTRNGEVLQDKTFLTVYKPWAAVYLRGPQQN